MKDFLSNTYKTKLSSYIFISSNKFYVKHLRKWSIIALCFCQVAIKVIDKKKARQDSYVLKNMKREPRIHQLIRHPNIVLLLETLETENCYYMAMELCGGGDLMDRICERKRLEEREVRRYTRQILSAVEHLHRHGIVHRYGQDMLIDIITPTKMKCRDHLELKGCKDSGVEWEKERKTLIALLYSRL